MSDPLSFMEQFSGDDLSALERARIASDRDDLREQREAERAEAEREAAREQRLESMAFGERAFGSPHAEMSRARAAYSAADDEVTDLQEKLRRAEAKRSRAESSLKFFAQRAQQAAGLAQRSAPSDPVEAAVSRAHEAFAGATRAALTEMRASRAERRPFVSRAAGAARRSEYCVHCAEAGVDDDTSYLLHSDPEFAVPVTSPEQAAQAAQAERRAVNQLAVDRGWCDADGKVIMR